MRSRSNNKFPTIPRFLFIESYSTTTMLAVGKRKDEENERHLLKRK